MHGTSTQTAASLPYAAEAARDARQRVVELLRDRCDLSVVETATVLVSELATNAVLHSAPPLQLRAQIMQSVIRVEMHDSTSAVPMPRRALETDSNGRGLAIMQALATRWGTEPTDTGKYVWFELSY